MSLFLKKYKAYNGKIYLTIVDGFRINGKVKQKVYKKLGYLEDLEKEYDDPISHFKDEIKKLKNDNEKYFYPPEKLLKDEINENTELLNIGYIFLKEIYNELGIEDYLKQKQNNLKINYNLNKIFSLLIYSRILYPGSKKETYEGKDRFFEPFNFSQYDIYRSLDYFNSYKNELEKLLWNNTKNKYNRNISSTYYDCTNYYFEIDYNDEDLVDEEGKIIEKGYRKRGPEKNHRPDPIVEMGLLMDASNLPLGYDLFPGNESEKLSLMPIVKRLKGSCNIDRTIVVADRGLNTSDNIFKLAGRNDKKNMDGYIYGQSIRGAKEEFKKWVLNQEGYQSEPIYEEDGKPKMFRQMIFDEEGNLTGYEKKQAYFKHKSRIYPKEISIQKDGKRNVKVLTDQKQLVYYSQNYADKQKRDRNQMIERAKDIIANPKKYDRVSVKGAKSYINNIKFVKSTGEIADGLDLSLKEDLIKEEEKYDGYYSIVTSELKMTDYELREKYRNLSKIEETFKITKSEIKSRPAFVWTKEHIEAHFLTCFIALYILRILEKKTNNEFSINKLIENIKSINCIHEFSNVYLISRSKDSSIFEKYFDINLNKKRISREDLKKILKY